MAHRLWTNDATLTVALWIAENARDWTAQTTREIFDAEDITQEIAVIQRNTATKLAGSLSEDFAEEAATNKQAILDGLEDCEEDIAHIDLSTVDYLQIATRIVEDLVGGLDED
jgi:DNA topoisomerase VI subunit B